MDIIKEITKEFTPETKWSDFSAGDSITVYYKIIEGNKTRTQFFQGVVIQRRGSGITETFTIRKVSAVKDVGDFAVLGNLGVGTTTPISKLHIVHASASPSTNGLRISDTGGINGGVTLGRNGSDGYFEILGQNP